ncbi:MAG: GFA family protein [Paracoccus sp. (in: a-proteobacteria)]|uniref:GFA family protein n=1 Tax=Paracoccus sp. TaxID=267 RepID=UPI0039E2FD9D
MRTLLPFPEYESMVSRRVFRNKQVEPPYHGGCECGAIRYTISAAPIVVYACHCTICQTQSGSAFGMAMRIPAESFSLTKGTLKTFRRTADSGQVFTNSFCPDCGTRIQHQTDRSPGQISLKPGTLDDTSWLNPSHHVFLRSAQKWVVIPEGAQGFKTVPADRSWLRGGKAD